MLVKDVYNNFIKEAEKPLRLRGRVVIGRNGEVMPRRHHLDYKALHSHRKALNDGVLCIPYRKGMRSALIATLFELKVNIPHSLRDKVVQHLKGLASSNVFRNNRGKTALQVFYMRSGKINDLEIEEKIISELCEMQRLTGMHPYGMKFAQIGFCIDILQGGKKDIYVRLCGGIKGEVLPKNQIRKAYKKNGRPVFSSLKDYDIKRVKEWKIEKAHKLYPIEEDES